MLIIEHFPLYDFEDHQRILDCSLQCQCVVKQIDKFHKIVLKKSVINYRTRGISDTAVHFSFLDTWEKGYFLRTTL